MRAGYEDMEVTCGRCGQPAERLFSPPGAFKVHGEVLDWDVKTADGKYRLSNFLEAQAEVAYAYDRRDQIEGVKGPRPDLFKRALDEARRRGVPIR